MIKSLVLTGILLAAGFSYCQSNPNTPAWQLLMDNKPLEAKALFQKNTSAPDKALSGEAYRGLSHVADFLGDHNEEAATVFKSYMADKNITLFAAAHLKAFSFGHTASGQSLKDGYTVLEELTKKPSLFCGQFMDQLIERYANDGDINAANRCIKNMGIPRSWMWIGPFDNMSNAGYSKTFLPETEIDFSKIYPGKDGNLARWNKLDNHNPSGWLFVENYTSARNAVFYFYTTVTSAKDQNALVSFGASGAFKIFVNGSCVMADSVFRNTGSDVFMNNVHLVKGNNSLLIKLCHEWGVAISDDGKLSNFLVRFLDTTYTPLKDISYTLDKTSWTPSKTSYNGAPSIIVDSIVNVLTRRLKVQENDLDAALLLMQAYNGLEKTDEGQILAKRYIAKYPKSSLWFHLYSESLFRSKKYTESTTALKTAYTLCPLNAAGWNQELQTTSRHGDARTILDFVASSPALCQLSLGAIIAKLRANITLENQAEVANIMNDLEKKFALDETAVSVLAALYIEQGQAKKAEQTISNYLSKCRTNAALYKAIASLALKQGDLHKTTDIINECLKYDPDNADLVYTLANFNFTSKNYAKAREYIEKCLTIMPIDADALNLKGNILVMLGDKQGAKQAFTEAIQFTNDDFNAWENIRSLNNMPLLESMAPLPPIDSVIAATKSWAHRNSENGAILSKISDVFYYPSHCSKERNFLVVSVPTQKAIDTWKEYEIPFNSHFQVLHIAKAMSYRLDGTQVQADVEDNRIVFKSLQPGDCIALEWTLKNYYTGEMAQNVYGDQLFRSSYPAFSTKLRLITPQSDTIPFQVYGDSITVSTKHFEDYRVTECSYPAYKNDLDESFVATDWPGQPKVNYSTFKSWKEIVLWYDGLSRNKLNNTLELTAIADSLYSSCKTDQEKVSKVHEYVTESIRYSYVPFRQSGWIPQDAHDVLATKIGDCKDMASLAKSLLDIAKIKCCLVLVNTTVRHYTKQAYIGPDFNHCILCYTIDGTDKYLDLTASNYPRLALPKQDQGSLALCIRAGNDTVTTLPFDAPENRIKKRTSVLVLNDNGTLKETVSTLRTGIFAGEYRDHFRFLSLEKRNADMHRVMAGTYPDVSLDTLYFTGLENVGDSLFYTTITTAKNTVTQSGSTAIFPLKIADNVSADDYPVEEKRNYPIDMYNAWYDISTCELSGELTFPATWKPISLPENTTLSSPYGAYTLEFKQNGNKIAYKRNTRFCFNKQIPVSDYTQLKTFLNSISKADAVQLLFFTK